MGATSGPNEKSFILGVTTSIALLNVPIASVNNALPTFFDTRHTQEHRTLLNVSTLEIEIRRGAVSAEAAAKPWESGTVEAGHHG